MKLSEIFVRLLRKTIPPFLDTKDTALLKIAELQIEKNITKEDDYYLVNLSSFLTGNKKKDDLIKANFIEMSKAAASADLLDAHFDNGDNQSIWFKFSDYKSAYNSLCTILAVIEQGKEIGRNPFSEKFVPFKNKK